MKEIVVGIFSDTHANLPALAAVLPTLRDSGCTELYHLGDCLAMGAYPAECMRILLDGEINCVLGNHDYSYLMNHLTQPALSHITKEHKAHQYKLAGDEFKEKISQLPLIIYKDYYGLSVAFTHYALTDNGEYERYWQPIIKHPDAATLDEMFENIDADIIFYGHDHSPCDVNGKKMYVCLGSLGCHKNSFARAVILRVKPDASYTYERICIDYNKNELFSEMDSRGIVDRENIIKYYFGGKTDTDNR